MGDAFGSLTWDADMGWWSGSAQVATGYRVDLHVEAANNPAELRTAIARAKPAWKQLLASEQAIRAVVASQMVEAHNSFCDPEAEVTPEQFAERLKLLSARFETSGSIELVYSDGMLFGGHWIIVPIGADGSVGEAFEAG